MQNVVHLPAYDKVAEIIESVNTLVTPAEVHGLFCGIICSGNNKIDPEIWAIQAMGLSNKSSHFSKKQTQVLKQLLEYSYNRLSYMEFDFQLLLPHDDISLDVRSAELGNWCHGFLLGLECSEDLDETNDRLSVEVYDTLTKISEIADIDYEGLDYNETDQAALLEVTEFVRLSILMVYSELNQNVSGTAVGSIGRTLH